MATNMHDTLQLPGIPSEPPPEMVSEGDMELMMAFREDLATAQRAYNILMNQFAARYQLREGDRIEMDRTITRRDNGART